GRRGPGRGICVAVAHSGDSGSARAGDNHPVTTKGSGASSGPGDSSAIPDPFLNTPLQYLKGVGPRPAADLEHAGLRTVEDLLYRFPIRYEDRSHFQPIASLKPGH